MAAGTFPRITDGHLGPAATSKPVTPRRVGGWHPATSIDSITLSYGRSPENTRRAAVLARAQAIRHVGWCRAEQGDLCGSRGCPAWLTGGCRADEGQSAHCPEAFVCLVVTLQQLADEGAGQPVFVLVDGPAPFGDEGAVDLGQHERDVYVEGVADADARRQVSGDGL